MLGIVDCNIGNIRSVVNAFNYLGASIEMVSEPDRLSDFDAIVLPGVGAFDAAMTSLRATGFDFSVKEFVATGKPLLGFCLGMQLLCNGSQEGTLPGLGLVDLDVINLRELGCRGKIPHVGFNSISRIRGESAFLQRASGEDFYFVHSFAVQDREVGNPELAVACAQYEGVDVVAAMQCRNIFATQFHPEKSGEAGLNLISEFLACLRNG